MCDTFARSVRYSSLRFFRFSLRFCRRSFISASWTFPVFVHWSIVFDPLVVFIPRFVRLYVQQLVEVVAFYVLANNVNAKAYTTVVLSPSHPRQQHLCDEALRLFTQWAYDEELHQIVASTPEDVAHGLH